MSLRDDPSQRPHPPCNPVPTKSGYRSQKRNFIPSPIFLVSKLPWLDLSELIDELLVFD